MGGRDFRDAYRFGRFATPQLTHTNKRLSCFRGDVTLRRREFCVRHAGRIPCASWLSVPPHSLRYGVFPDRAAVQMGVSLLVAQILALYTATSRVLSAEHGLPG